MQTTFHLFLKAFGSVSSLSGYLRYEPGFEWQSWIGLIERVRSVARDEFERLHHEKETRAVHCKETEDQSRGDVFGLS